MGRKSNYDKLVDDLSKALRERKPATSIEQAMKRDQSLSNILGMEPPTEEEYEVGECGHILWHGVCYVCE